MSKAADLAKVKDEAESAEARFLEASRQLKAAKETLKAATDHWQERNLAFNEARAKYIIAKDMP